MGFDARSREVREYTEGEEAVNSLTHAFGAVLAAVGLALLVAKTWERGGASLAAGVVFGTALLAEYLFSAFYHAVSKDGAKRVLKVLDHCGIYLLIAGSYTPYCLCALDSSTGIPILAAVWVAAVVGSAVEAFWTFRPRWVSAAIYLAMGWCVVALLPALHGSMAPAGLWLLVAGGLCYTVGAAFYVLKRVRYMHSVFHVFVMAGSLLHFLSVYQYVV